jgi:copper(I)-binding protein
MRSGITILLITLALNLAACGSGPAGPQISVEDAWARPAPVVGGNAGVFMRLVNTGDEADRLVGGESSVAGAVEIHKTVMSGDVMKMEPIQGLEIPSRDEVQLKPGGLHIMLIEVNQPLAPGDAVPIALHFEKSGEIELQVEVREP